MLTLLWVIMSHYRNDDTSRKISLLCVCLVALFSSNLVAQSVVSNQMIWKGDKYAAFTSLVYFKGYFYCAFRDANKHFDATGNDLGKIRILKSKKGTKWEDFLVFEEPDCDLRDPQLSITPQKCLMLLTEKITFKDGRETKRNTCSSLIQKDGSHTNLFPLIFEEAQNWNWLWNVVWIDKIAYGFTYVPIFSFVKSVDGIRFFCENRFDFPIRLTEGSMIKIRKNILGAVVRGDNNAWIGEYDMRTKKWIWIESNNKIACPKIVKVKKDLYVVGRSYDKGTQVTLFKYDVDERIIKRLIDIAGSKDCSYPGVVLRRGYLYVSYYLGDGSQSDIYLSIVKI